MKFFRLKIIFSKILPGFVIFADFGKFFRLQIIFLRFCSGLSSLRVLSGFFRLKIIFSKILLGFVIFIIRQVFRLKTIFLRFCSGFFHLKGICCDHYVATCFRATLLVDLPTTCYMFNTSPPRKKNTHTNDSKGVANLLHARPQTPSKHQRKKMWFDLPQVHGML